MPTWVLPDSMLPPHHDNDNPSLTREKMRPDVMLVELTPEEQRTYYRAHTIGSTLKLVDLPNLLTRIEHSCKRRKVWPLEVGYSSETKYKEKFQEKTLQHQALVNALTQWGYDVHLRPLPLGFASTVYNTNLKTLIDLGVTRH